jgi:hypothetical protein
LKKIAIFTEGQTELIFIRHFLLRILDPSRLSFECFDLLSHRQFVVPFKHSNPYAEVHFLILNVHGDEGVLSSIKEREENLFEKGYEKIIGLRDLYSDEYMKRSYVINDRISRLIIQKSYQTIGEMRNFERIQLYFAIMEIEAWFLGMYTIFQKIESLLTVDYIKQNLNIDLRTTDPQKSFFQPSNQVDQIFQLCGGEYKKKQAEVERICTNIDTSDLDAALENNRCTSFNEFYHELMNCF